MVRLIIALLFCCSIHAVGQTRLGVFVSNDNSRFTGDKPAAVSYELGSGFIAGFKVKFPLEHDLSLSIEPSYIFGKAFISEKDTLDPEISYQYDVKNGILSLPVKLNAYITQRFYASAGMEFSCFVNSDMKMRQTTVNLLDSFNRFNFSLSFGLGYSISIGRYALDLELSYVQMVNKLSENSADDFYVPRIRLASTRLSAAFLIPITSAHE